MLPWYVGWHAATQYCMPKPARGRAFSLAPQRHCNKELLQEHNDLDQSVDHTESWISLW